MKLFYKFLLTAFVAALFLAPSQQTFAQDELVVEWADPGSGEVVVNALRDAIAADSLRPEGRVYVLQRGGFYWITDRISNQGFHLTIVGETEDAVAAGETDYGPAIIQRVAREGGDDPDATMFESTGSLTLKNVWLMGQSDQGITANYEPIKLLGDGETYTFDNVIFDRNDWHHLGPDGPNNDFHITNCKFRNHFGPTQIWEGLGIRLEVGADTVVIENNTFFNIGFTPFQSEAVPANYLRFNHNTLVNIGRSFSAGSIWKSAYVTNNIVVNGFWQGEDYDQYSDPDREDPYTGFFSIAELPARFGTNYERKIVLANNSYWRDDRFQTYYDSEDPAVRAQPFVNDTTTGYFNTWDNMKMENNYIGERPNLVTYPDVIDNMVQYIKDLRADPQVIPATAWYWDPGRDEECYVCNVWPLPEDFSYTNTTLLTGGTDGLPLGDLNWFPESMDTWLTNKVQYVADIENKVAAPDLEILGAYQAEDATLAGETAVEAPEGFIYFQMDGSGMIEWTFELAAGGQYDINVWTHMRDNAQRGQHTFINGVEIHDAAHGWGELIYDNAAGVTNGMPIDDWTWVRWTQNDINEAGALTFVAGTNVIKITPSWGWQNFAGIDLLEPGTDNIVISLRAPDAVYEGVTPMAVGIPWVPDGFKSVKMGAGGSVSFDLDVAADGNYMVRLFFAAVGSSTGQIGVGGQNVSTVTFSDTGDVFTDIFEMSAGSNTLSVTADQGGVNLDYVQLIKITPVTGVDDELTPDGYALEQNYPNPFNPSTSIKFSLAKASNVKLTIFNILGQKVATLVNNQLNAGTHIVRFNASLLASGVYFYGIEAGDFKAYKKMMLLK
ncbi:MAG: T9SS type A sorting domain-containing protein [Melioribacteraceae bacterium]|nr:T9SS type A sorting domain-containing protein [Melioribacteraceae bacterium]